MLRPLLATILACLMTPYGWTQPQLPGQPPLSPAAAKVKSRVMELPVGGRVTVNMRDGAQYCGTVASIDAESFSVHEVDLGQRVTVRYEEAARVRKDYGRKGFGGRRVHPRTSLIAGICIVGALLAVVIAAVASDKS